MGDMGRNDPFENIEYGSDYNRFISDINAARKNFTLDKGVIKSPYTGIGFDDIDGSMSRGKYEMDRNGFKYRFFLNPSESEYMYVFLNGMGSEKDYYSRWSWNANGFTLAIMDPMVLMYPMPIGWYFGTKEVDLRKELAEFIMKIAGSYGFSADKIVLYGSSGGEPRRFTSRPTSQDALRYQ